MRILEVSWGGGFLEKISYNFRMEWLISGR